MISNYTRDSSFFQNLSESNTVVNYKDFDNEIYNLVNYLNKRVVSFINNIVAMNYNGIIGNNNYVLKNIGNGKLIFDDLNDSNYQNNSINLNKFSKVNPNSIMFINLNKGVHFIKELRSSKLSNLQFYNREILSVNIEANAIGINHVNNAGKSYLLNKVLVNDRHIINNSLNVNNFTLRSITYDNLHQDIKNSRENINNYLTYTNTSITSDKIKTKSFDFRLISTNLLKFGYGILHRNVIPLNSVPIAKPDQYASETIDTFQLSMYEIATAYQLNTYQNPQPDSVYVNPRYTQTLALYNSVSADLTASNLRLNQLKNLFIVRQGQGSPFETYVEMSRNPKLKGIRALLKPYLDEKRYYDRTFVRLEQLNRELLTIPRNIYTPVPPISYQRLELVPNAKSYKNISKQCSIKSNHLKAGFNIGNIPDRLTKNNVPSAKFINKSLLSQAVKTKLNLVG